MRHIWDLCVHTLQYGVHEVIQDCMEREKGFYVGDGCYTAYAHMQLTGDDTIVRKLIDDAFRSTFITPGMVTCLDCAMMQEIAEYPLMLLSLMRWHAEKTGDLAYLASHFDEACALLDVYRRDYERDGLLSHLDKWCVVEWPKNFQDGYDIDIREGKICEPAHVSLNAYYIEAIRNANAMARLLGRPAYRDESPLVDAFYRAFYMPEAHSFRDGVGTDHSSFIANTMAYAYGLVPDEGFRETYLSTYDRRGVISVLSNILPVETMEICRRFFRGDVAGAAKLQLDLLPLIDALFCEVNPIPVKAACAAMGFCDNTLRLPLTPMEPAHEAALLSLMRQAGLAV